MTAVSGERLVVAGVKKSFGATKALVGVDFSAAAGEVHALVGENGAGKSTLLKILAGVHEADEGSITLDGAPFRPRDPIAARAAGVAMVHQELSLCPHMTVAENVLLGEEPTRFGFVARGEASRKVDAVLARVLGDRKKEIRPSARVSDLSPAAQQLVEIARALALPSCRVLVLDEPTSSLARDDVERLFSLVRALRDDGITVLYVSHFLEEVQRIADRYTVLRDGATVTTGSIADASMKQIVEAMAGRAIENLFPRSARTPGDSILRVQSIVGVKPPQGAVATTVQHASFDLRRGEVLGVAGLVGAGRTELVRAIFGLDPVARGEIKVGAYVGPASPTRRLDQGVGFVSEDRKGEGLAVSLSIADNLTLSKLEGFGPAGIVLPARQRTATRKWIDRLAVKCRDEDQKIVELSGGNQQKVAIARLLHHDVDVFLLDEPTRGIDVGSKAQIYALIDELALAGKAVLVISSYLPELLGICDRIAVMHRGRLGDAHEAHAVDEKSLLAEATGT
jgi:ribose transport system ATP-binding protein